MIIDFNLIQQLPQELKDLQTFVLWEHYLDEDEPKKRPFDWRTETGHGKGNNDPNLHLSFDDALAKIKEIGSEDIGLAIYQPDTGTPIMFEGKQTYLHIVDLDGFVAALDGKTKFLGLGSEIVELCNDSYFEVSPSGRGVKIFVVSDMPPTKKETFKLPKNDYADTYPDVKKYNESHAVEIFSKGYWNCITGDRWTDKYPKLKFVSMEQLKEIYTLLQSRAPAKKQPELLQHLVDTPQSNNKLTPKGLINVLARIDNQPEDVWSDVANSLARVYGASGEDYFVKYSKGEYNKQPYAKYNELDVRIRFSRAVKEVDSRPSGYGIRRLCQLAGVDVNQQEFEVITSVNNQLLFNGITAEELSLKTFPPMKWAIQDILPEGCYLLTARPKVGKSWLALQLCLAVAFGGSIFGKNVVKGKAVYLALEDNQRRLQSRLKQLRPQGFATPDLILHTDWLKFDKGGVEKLIELIEKEKPKLIVIDTLAKVRPESRRNNGVYTEDYQALEPITKVANQYRCTILIVHHNRKGKSESDPIEQVSGSLGLTGAVDGSLVIDGNRSDKMYTLSLIGRDIPNDDALAIARQANGEWHLLGQAKAVFISSERKEIAELLKLNPKGLKPKEISDILCKKPEAVRKLLLSMASEQQIINTKGTYTHPNALSIGNSSNLDNIGSSGNCGNSNHLVTIDA
jgi:hypothetical protein